MGATTTARGRSLTFNTQAGLGDDFMTFWSAAAAVLAGIAPQGLRLRYLRPSTAGFLARLAEALPELTLLSGEPAEPTVLVRGAAWRFNQSDAKGYLRSLVDPRVRYVEPHATKLLGAYGADNPAFGETVSMFGLKRYRLACSLGRVRTWREPYGPLYDGWMEVALALGLSHAEALAQQPRLAEQWPELHRRLAALGPLGPPSPAPRLFLPEGSGYHDLTPETIALVRGLAPDLKVVRYVKEDRPADLTFSSLDELAGWLQTAELVVTGDSMPSHLAQLLARRHVLICTRSAPHNVCFPSAGHTQAVDLGESLPCRWCAPAHRTDPLCPAGQTVCLAQVGIEGERLAVLARAVGDPRVAAQ
jgi:hypothetical protein